MRIEYTVHSANVEKVAVKASLNGREVDATVDGLVVELLDGETHGHTFRFAPEGAEDMAAHKELFAVGSAVIADFSRKVI